MVLVTIFGWLLLAIFAWRAGQLGGIEVNVGQFQAAYLIGCGGYLLLVWVVRAAGGRTIPGRWRWWLLGCLVLRVWLLNTAPGNDSYRYVWEGRVSAAGFNPYFHPPEDPLLAGLRDENWTNINHRDYSAIYPPLAQFEFLVAAWIHPSIGAINCWHAFWDFLAVAVLGAVLRHRGRSPHQAIIYGLCPLVLSSFAIEGHLDSLMLILAAASLWAAMVRRELLAGALLGAAVAAKLVVIVLLPWFLIRHRRTAIAALFVLAMSYLPFVDAKAKLFDSLIRFSGTGGMLSLLGTIGLTNYESTSARLLVGGLLAVVVIALARRVHDPAVYCLEATGALLMLMPVIHFWYFSWALLFSAVAKGNRWIVGAVAMVGYFEAYRRQTLTGTWMMPHWVGWMVWLPVLAAGVLDLLSRRTDRRCRMPRGGGTHVACKS